VIRVDKRMSYNEIQGIIENDEEIIKNIGFDKEKLNMVKLYEKLTNILLKRRQKNGYIGFDMPEVQIIEEVNLTLQKFGLKLNTFRIDEHLLNKKDVSNERFRKR